LLEIYFTANAGPAASAPPGEPAADALIPPSKVPLAATTAITHQIAEVKRVQALIKAKLAEDMPAVDKLALLRGWVLYQAEDYKTRVEYLRLTSPRDELGREKAAERLKADIEALEKILDTRFNGALAKPQVSDSPVAVPAPLPADPKELKQQAEKNLAKSAEWRAGVPLDDTQRRLNIAHLLVHLDPTDAAWQKRVMLVVGLRRYVKALTVQVLRLADMRAHVELGIPGDQAAFIKTETQLREQATRNQERAKAVAEIKTALTEQQIAKKDAVSRQQTQLNELTGQLTKIKTEVDELLVKQTGLEKQLFEIQREVGLTLEDVYRLELLLERVERERLGLPPVARP
jgi:hypothetical protein